MKKLLTILVCWCALNVAAQEPVAATALQLPGRYLHQLEQKMSVVKNGLSRRADKLLRQAAKREAKLKRKLQSQQPELARRLFTTSIDSLTNMRNPMTATGVGEYLPWLDSAETTLKFLQNNSLAGNIDSKEIKAAMAQLQALKNNLAHTEKIKAYLKERKEVLLQQLGKLPGYGRQLQKLNESIYYYQQSINEWKTILSDPKKLEQKAMALLMRTQLFQNFMARNSQLAQLFPQAGAAAGTNPLAGLQTRTQVNGLLQQQLQAGGADAQAAFQQQVQNAMGQLNQLKNGGYGNGSAADMPDFKPKAMKHKRFISRIEPGFNLQVQKNNRFFPTVADVGAQVRYAAGKGAGVGVGMSYKLGLGTGWKDIRLTSNGMGLRGFADAKLKGNFWFNAGFEMNYLTGFTSLAQLQQRGQWQQSALAGLSKKFNVGKKMKGSMLLLYDFLHKQHLPNTQAFVYRITYSFK
jgi:hypothetical protein